VRGEKVIKDSVGNRLSEGQFVQLRLPPGISALNGRIKSIDEGRIARIGGAHKGENGSVTPGCVTVEITVPVDVDPRSNIAMNISRLWDASGKDLELAAVAAQQKV
jgi:hypothetical protein